MPESLVRDLFDGPLDIVGDVHGELVALENLLRHLGYSADGSHPEQRRLVFVGDLTDRGPNSPGVVTRVQELVESGKAQCVLGNHDLNILLDDRKHDNHWFFGEEFALDRTCEITPAVLADKETRDQVTQFFKTLPVALERDDLRVIHACWDDEMIGVARRSSDAVALHHEHAERITSAHNQQPELDKSGKEIEIQ
jgi:predicted MPP superfamily phosphohydrolase